MSYILDALKKNQAEQAETGVSLETPRRNSSRWLATGLVAVLVINLGLLAWIVLDKSLLPGADTPAAASEPTTLPAQEAATATASKPTTPDKQAKTEATLPTRTAEPTESVVAPPPVAADETATPSAPAPTPRESSVQPTALAELPAQEQILYNGFNYSTHIYTDDPTLCAVVIDGQRLTAGDSFKGLQVVAITETGVVFEETRRGQRRQVEVSVLEQWERQ